MKTKRLMVVDDSMVFRNRICRLATDPRLAGLLQMVALAENGLMAIEQVKAHRPDFFTMDLTMPVMDGPACLQALGTVLPDARILVVSVLSDRATALKALTRGTHGFLLKPFSDARLIESLHELMA